MGISRIFSGGQKIWLSRGEQKPQKHPKIHFKGTQVLKKDLISTNFKIIGGKWPLPPHEDAHGQLELVHSVETRVPQRLFTIAPKLFRLD